MRSRVLFYPKISIVIPVFNGGDFLAEAINSALGQTYGNFEVIVVNDGSADNGGTRRTCLSYGNRIIYIEKSNGGTSSALNTGLKAMTGDYFCWLSHDDLYKPKFVEECVAKLRKLDDKRTLITTDLEIIDKNGKVTWPAALFNVHRKRYAGRGESRIYPVLFMKLHGCQLMIHKSVFKEVGEFSEDWKVAHDFEFFARAFKAFDNALIPKVLGSARDSDNRQGKRLKTVGAEEYSKLFLRIFEELSDEEITQIAPSKLALQQELLELWQNSGYFPAADRLEELMMSHVHINYTDAQGAGFNGFDLHLAMRQRGKSATQIVWKKTSSEESVYGLSDNLPNKIIYRIVTKLQAVFNSHSMLSPLMNDIFNHPFFLDSKVVHLHILNHPAFNLQAIPLMSSLKPTVWSIHDPWILSGHCIHHKDCQKWQSHCYSCPMLEIPYPISQDNTALAHAQKKSVVKNSTFVVHVASNWMKEKLKASRAFEGKQIRVIPFGVQQEIFSPGPGDAFRRRHGIGMGTKVIFARINSNFKGQDTIFEAIKKVADSIGEFTLLLVGEKLPRGNGIPKSVRVIQMGWLKNPTVLAEAYRACDVFLMPSEQESFGLMAAEAMSCGKVVLAIQDAQSALGETINSPECGLAVRKEDYPDALLNLLVDPQGRETRELNSLTWARQQYSWDTYLDRMENLYKDAAEEFTETLESKLIHDQLRLHAGNYRSRYFSQASTKVWIREVSKLVKALKKNGFRWLLVQGWSLAWWKITAAFAK